MWDIMWNEWKLVAHKVVTHALGTNSVKLGYKQCKAYRKVRGGCITKYPSQMKERANLTSC
jgi:hypothetical protein